MTTPLRLALACAAASLLSLSALAAEPWDAPPFTADPKAMIEAAQRIDPGKADRIVLLDQATYTFDERGECHIEFHSVYRVVTPKGTSALSSASARWAPWYAERPRLRARVVAADGSVHTLDPSTVTEASTELERDIFSDERVLHAPLPGVAAGSVVEVVIDHAAKSVIRGAGMSAVYPFGTRVPNERIRLILDGPASFEPHIVNKSPAVPRIVEKDGRKQIIFETGPNAAIENIETYLPPDEAYYPYVAFSTGTSWREIAEQYEAIVDKQIAGSDLHAAAAAAKQGAKDRQQLVARLLAYVQSNVHYAGVEVAEGSIVPRPPSGVLQNKYGDCKDKATLLVALLRAAGLSANVVLLNAGVGLDVLADLPAANRFNHAIVVVDGAPPIWVDPTDEFARAGELPPQDQGRFALIAASGTTSLTRTPELASSADHYLETRTFTLPEEGKTRVHEVTGGSGPAEALLRRWIATTEAKKLEEEFEKYGKSYYLAEKFERLTYSDPRDIAKPLAIELEVSNARAGVVRNGEGSVAVNLQNLFSYLPLSLRDYKEPRPGDTDRASKKRVHDFVSPRSFSKEWAYRFVLPAGYKARTLPENETAQLGTMTLRKEYAEKDGVIVANFRLDTGKRRLTPAEFEQTRMAVSRAMNAGTIFLRFGSIGQAKLDAGDIRGALEEFRRLAALHPKEAQHHMEIARALLAGGLGDAARAAAKRAVEVEPSSAPAHALLGEVLQYDTLGRKLRGEFDLPLAIAELRKAKELDPKGIEIRRALAEALAMGDDGYRFGRNAALPGAIDEYQSIIKDFGQDADGDKPRLMLFLAHARRWEDLKRHLETMDSGEQKTLGRILAAAGGSGIEAGLRELDAFAAAERRQYAAAVAGELHDIGLYQEAAAMYDAATAGTETTPEAKRLITLLRKAKHGGPADDGTPQSVLLRLIRALAENDDARIKTLLSPALEKMEALGKRHVPDGFTPATFADLMVAAADVQREGDDATGYRLRMRSSDSHESLTVYAQRVGTKYVLTAANDSPWTVGAVVLDLAEAGKLDAARKWLNWAREEMAPGGGDDPLMGSAFPPLWPKEKQTATAAEIRLAAAALMAGHATTAPRALPILTVARESAPDEQKTWIDVALVQANTDKSKVAEVADRLRQRHPDSVSAFIMWAMTMGDTGRGSVAEAAAKERLERSPRDRAALYALHVLAAGRHDYAAAAAYARRIVDELNPTQNDYNEAAWTALFTTKDLERAIDDARRASDEKSEHRSAALHTLAAVYAESGRNSDARQALLQSISIRQNDEPASSDWYVFGRIAENYGVADAALAAYRRVEKRPEDTTGLSTWELAQRRLALLSPRK